VKPQSFLSLLLSLAIALLGASCAHVARGPETPPTQAASVGADQMLQEARRELSAYERRLPAEQAERATVLTQACRLSFLTGDLAAKEEKSKYFEKGERYAEMLLQDRPAWVDGHYWLALNLCGQAENAGAKQGLRLLPRIVEHLEKAAAIDPTYDQGGPHRVLGRIYHEAPAWPMSVGDPHKALHHLTKAVQIAPDNSTNHLYLGETLLLLGKKNEARQEFEKALRCLRHALGPHGLEEDHQEARRHLGYPVK